VGWSYRRSVRVGPLRINFSKSGVGYSVGGGGFRTGVRPNGRRYSRYTIPGTGLSYQPSHGAPSNARGPGGCLVVMMLLGGLVTATSLLLDAG